MPSSLTRCSFHILACPTLANRLSLSEICAIYKVFIKRDSEGMTTFRCYKELFLNNR